MARTFIGELVLRLRDNMSGQAKQTARNVESSLVNIERAGRQLADAKWGAGFESQIRKLAISPAERAHITTSWDSVQRHIRNNNLNKALAKSEISPWKATTISSLASVRSEWTKTERKAEAYENRLRKIAKQSLRPAYVALGGYTGTYMLGESLRSGFVAGSERHREQFRQDMSSIPQSEKDQIDEKATQVSQTYKSITKTDSMEMSRVARNLMGDTERGMAVLDRIIEALVVLQSTKGGEVAVRELAGLLKGFDNIGINKDGQKGVDLVNEMIEAFVKASQIEGQEFDAGRFFSFAQRTKVAGPALSPEFLAISPVIMQDMSPDAAGNSLSMLFKAFVLEAVGSAGGASYLRERERIGIRDENGIVDAGLLGRNPIEWTRKYLVPALIKDGVDMTDATAISQAVGELSGNSNAMGLLTRFITQKEQIDRTIGLYNNSMGTDAAKKAGIEDPFVAYRGFIASMEDFSAATLPMKKISSGLDTMSGAIKRAAKFIEENPELGSIGTGVAVAGGVGVAALLAKGVYGLMTAGTNLNAAAASLQRAAAIQAGGDIAGSGRSGAKGKGSGKGRLAAGAITAGVVAGGSIAPSEGVSATEAFTTGGLVVGGPGGAALGAVVGLATDSIRAIHHVSTEASAKIEMARQRAVAAEENLMSQFVAPSLDAGASRAEGAKTAAPDQKVKVDVDDISLQQSQSKVEAAGNQMEQSLSVTGRPQVDTSSIDQAIGKANQLKQALAGAREQANRAANAVSRELDRTFADAGVTP